MGKSNRFLLTWKLTWEMIFYCWFLRGHTELTPHGIWDTDASERERMGCKGQHGSVKNLQRAVGGFLHTGVDRETLKSWPGEKARTFLEEPHLLSAAKQPPEARGGRQLQQISLWSALLKPSWATGRASWLRQYQKCGHQVTFGAGNYYLPELGGS